MTPVEQTSICSGRQPTASAATAVMRRASSSPLPAGAGIGVAGADDDSAHVVGRQPLLADAHRGGADAVLREDAGRRGGRVADDEGQVEALGVGTKAAVDAGETVAASEMPVGHDRTNHRGTEDTEGRNTEKTKADLKNHALDAVLEQRNVEIQ